MLAEIPPEAMSGRLPLPLKSILIRYLTMRRERESRGFLRQFTKDGKNGESEDKKPSEKAGTAQIYVENIPIKLKGREA